MGAILQRSLVLSLTPGWHLSRHRVSCQRRQRQPTIDEHVDAEQWEAHLDEVLDFLENGQLSLQVKSSVFVEHTAEDVPQLDDGDKLVDGVLAGPVQHHLEELGVIVQVPGERELVLE